MRIGLNGQYIQIDNPAGPERFTLNLYRALAQNDKVNNYTLYLSSDPEKSFIKDIFGENQNFEYKVLKGKHLWTQFHLAYELLKNKQDVFFTPIHTLPFIRNPRTKYVAMIHGLEYKSNQEFNSFSVKKIYHPSLVRAVINSANKVVVPSAATKDAVLSDTRIKNPNKIMVINEGVSGEFFPRTEQEISQSLFKYSLEYKKYLLFVSTIQPRKNVVNLIKAFSVAQRSSSIPSDFKLAIVGKLGWKYQEVLEAPLKYGVEQLVKFLHWIPQEDLPKLFSGASAYVNLSLEEGFGLTVLEAMATQIPVLVSDINAHREVGKDTIRYTDPLNVELAAEKIQEIVSQKYPSDLLERAMERTKNFNWDSTAKKFIDLFSSLGPR